MLGIPDPQTAVSESTTDKVALTTTKAISTVLSHVLAFLAGALTAAYLLLDLPMVG